MRLFDRSEPFKELAAFSLLTNMQVWLESGDMVIDFTDVPHTRLWRQYRVTLGKGKRKKVIIEVKDGEFGTLNRAAVTLLSKSVKIESEKQEWIESTIRYVAIALRVMELPNSVTDPKEREILIKRISHLPVTKPWVDLSVIKAVWDKIPEGYRPSNTFFWN